VLAVGSCTIHEKMSLILLRLFSGLFWFIQWWQHFTYKIILQTGFGLHVGLTCLCFVVFIYATHLGWSLNFLLVAYFILFVNHCCISLLRVGLWLMGQVYVPPLFVFSFYLIYFHFLKKKAIPKKLEFFDKGMINYKFLFSMIINFLNNSLSFKNSKISWWKYLWCSNHAYKISERNLTHEYMSNWNKIKILHVLVEKSK